MSKTTSNKEKINELFKAEATDWLEPEDGEGRQWLSYSKPEESPVLPEPEPPVEEELKAYWRNLRAFFQSGKGGNMPYEPEVLQTYPALLAPYWGGDFTQRDYPCWLNDRPTGEKGFFTLPDFLTYYVAQFAPEEGKARILKDNLIRLENIIREKLGLVDEPFKAYPVMEEALQELKAQLAISGEEAKQFSEEIKGFLRKVPKEGVLIPFSPNAALHMLSIMIGRQLKQSRQTVKDQINQLSHQLQDIIQVEQEKTSEAHSPEHLQSSLEFADSFLNFDELSSLLPSGASQAIPEERYQRIDSVLKTLEKADELLFNQEALVCLEQQGRSATEIDWKHSFPFFSIQETESGRLSQIATNAFEEVMKKAADLFAAIRIGKIEAENNYSSEWHAEFFKHFDWHHFNEQEMQACSPVLLVAEWQQIKTKELDDFSRLLASNRPIKFLIEQLGCETNISEEVVFRQEPGALAVAHRNTFVLQGAVVEPAYLNGGFMRGLRASSPALFYLLSPLAGQGHSPSTDLWASAAVEGREFPGFIFDSRQGPKWGNRFDIQNNPATDNDWPEHQLPIRQKGKETTLTIPFTFADFAAQDRRFANYFQLVPACFWSEDLIPLADYLKGNGEDVLTKVPFIWLINKENTLERAAVAWPLVQICQERLDFWHYLQENAGVHSYHVEKATEQLRQELEEDMQQKLSSMEASFKKDLAEAKEASARQAMEQLAAVLLDLDTDAILTDSPVSKSADAPTPKVEVEVEQPGSVTKVEPPAEKQEEEVLSLGEAWIDTPLCTSCNECIDTNSKVFQYNAEKQAFVADPAGGPFADIVKAAENCPVRIIHPGAPHNPDEPNLEEWVKRAEPFQ